MTTTTPGPTTLTPTLSQLWRRSRWFLAGALVLLLAALLIGGLGGSGGYPALDPRSADPDGARATAQLLRRQGVTVDPVDTPAALDASPGADTVLLPLPDLLTPDQLRDLAAAGHRRLVLIDPGDTALGILAPGVHPAETAGIPLSIASASTAPDCPLPEAQLAGSAELGGQLYDLDAGTTGCYPREGHPALAEAPGSGGTEVIVLGSGRFLTNQALAQDGNASLALGLLGSQPQLTWYLPDYSSVPQQAGQRSFTDLIPAGWSWGALQLAVAAVLAALWRARRLGPVVSEQLPVVVRAAETTEGRARLYQRAKARGQAAESLRRAARHRLAPVLGVPVTAGEPDGTALLAALADRLDRRSPDQRDPGGPHTLLYGPPPTDDAALLRLADDLDALERQVRQP
ncbi:hypothetical protein P3T37_004718 [Kitasatospora sp. MAA4]|uniref:DUF4350 domain-containing protein n=1 Tax=Kitasatospora sp. MAA4 TaxID=3035093 RepID=UPI0024751031|nr:DUF4350 domain-containing protein [Kitasatospora sp. MAA4]MDH6135308.1 hypothetical protein [Kitasatospora sp. MAA4]